MKYDYASSDASLMRGYAWHVYPDPATPGALDGDTPFEGVGSPTARPPGVVAFWTVGGKVPALRNQVEDRAYLVLTEKHDPPPVGDGWEVEAARLAENFELDQRGRRSARLVRIVRTAETKWGMLQDCEFQIDRT